MTTPDATRSVHAVRHGETTTNLARIATGQMDVGLTEKGKQQAEACRALIRAQDLKIDAIVCSGLRRTKETADIINAALNLPVFQYPELNEQSYGDWEGQNWEFVLSKIETEGEDPPNGESRQAFADRVKSAIVKALDEHPGNILLVTHAGVLEALLSGYEFSGKNIENGVLYEVDLFSGTLHEIF